MSDAFFERPILNSPYEYPRRHWELDAKGQPTQRIIESRRRADLITPIPKRDEVDRGWRLPNPADWRVTPETALKAEIDQQAWGTLHSDTSDRSKNRRAVASP